MGAVMDDRHFGETIRARWRENKMLCVGLDSDIRKIPASCRPDHDAAARVEYFNASIVEATSDIAGAYKLNTAFYEALGGAGVDALVRTVRLIQNNAPGVPVIVDAKRADIESTNEGYATALFDKMRADAVTVNPYLGGEALRPFLRRAEKGVFVLARTSNPGAGELQDLQVAGRPLYLHVADRVATHWNTEGNCGIVAGATFGSELRRLRAAVGTLPMLVPGVGAQGADLATVVSAGFVPGLGGVIVNSSRSIIFASARNDYAAAARLAARSLHEAVVRHLPTGPAAGSGAR
jgi:orotidine-5'-phosphate decarboxylase